MKTFKTLFIFATMALFIGACSNTSKQIATLDLSNLDTTANPANDFFRYVNGTWYDKTEIPDDHGSWGSFEELRKNNNATVLEVLEKAAENKNYAAGSDQRKAADFYAVGMDSVLAEKRGVEPLRPWLEKIDGINSLESLQDVLAEMHVVGFTGFFGIGVFGDLKNSSMNALYLFPNALGLPNSDYYTKEDSSSVQLREKYVKHIARMLAFIEDPEVDFSTNAQSIYDLEHQLALAKLTPIEERNIALQYNKMNIAELSTHTPSVDWTKYLSDNLINDVDTIIVTEPEFMKEVEVVINETPLNVIKEYLKWHLIDRASGYLNKEIVQANFDFYGKELSGSKEMRPRWERVLGLTNSSLGEALGKLYVDEVFPPEAKQQAEDMVADLILALGNRIDALDWMSDETKKAAHHKLDKITVKVGYPNKWKDYSTLKVENSGNTYSYFENRLNASYFEHLEAVEKIGKPVDKEEWNMTPQTVNAYYNPINNEIVFPAAILQPPFFYFNADPAINFGAIGAVIGHEMSHGFDDQGCRFDAEGNMINWWTDEDKANFDERSKQLIDQFNAYEALPGLFVQGELTLGENIGDLGGINIAYDGLQKYFETHEKPGLIGGYTQEQRFFLSWGTVWREKVRDESLRTQVQTDPHSPGKFRANGPLENLETFYAAFDVKEGDAMWKPDSLRVRIW